VGGPGGCSSGGCSCQNFTSPLSLDDATRPSLRKARPVIRPPWSLEVRLLIPVSTSISSIIATFPSVPADNMCFPSGNTAGNTAGEYCGGILRGQPLGEYCGASPLRSSSLRSSSRHGFQRQNRSFCIPEGVTRRSLTSPNNAGPAPCGLPFDCRIRADFLGRNLRGRPSRCRHDDEFLHTDLGSP
jgi:hypothetical protein